jgi:hypothetical protein
VDRRSLIGDPREGVYKVSFTTNDMKEAMTLARQLARIGIVPTTTISHDVQFGAPIFAHVNIYAKTDQKCLFEITESKVDQARRKQLEDLVLARGPIPEEIVEKIAISAERGRTPEQIAAKMNQVGIIAGMGGIRWTGKKVRAALDDYRRRTACSHEAA